MKFGEEWGDVPLSWQRCLRLWFVERYSYGLGDYCQNTQFEIRVGNRVRLWHAF